MIHVVITHILQKLDHLIICVDSSFENDSEYESESEIDTKEKCCVCGLFYLKQVKESGFNVITLRANTAYTSNVVLKLTLQLEEVLNTSVNTVKMNFQKNSYNLLLLKWNVCLNLKFGMKFKHKRFCKIIIMKI